MQPEQDQVVDIELLHAIARGDEMAFTTDASGAGTLQDQIPAQARNAAVFAMTLEPESGVQSPTGQIYLSSPS